MKKIMVVGAGGWGYTHIRQLLHSSCFEIAGCVDPFPEVLAELRYEYHLPENLLFSDFNLAYQHAPVDGYLINFASPERLPIIKYLLENKRPVLLESPAAYSIRELKEILQWQKDTEVSVSIVRNFNREPFTQYIRELIQNNRFGPLSQIRITLGRNGTLMEESPTYNKDGNQSLVMNLCGQHFDLLHNLLGVTPLQINAYAWRPDWSWSLGNTGLECSLLFPDNILVSFQADWSQPYDTTSPGGKWEFVFKNAILNWNHGTTHPLTWQSVSPNKNQLREESNLTSPLQGTYSQNQGLDLVHDEFCESFSNPETSRDQLVHYIPGLTMALAVYQSANNQRPIIFPDFLEESQLKI